MRKVYKNKIYEIIKTQNIDPNQFNMSEFPEGENTVAKLNTFDNKMSFKFKNPSTSWELFQVSYSYFTPDFKQSGWIPMNNKFFNPDQMTKAFLEWLNGQIKPYFDEIDGIDKWSNLEFEKNILAISQIALDNTNNFTLEDSAKITASIDELKKLVTDNFALNEHQLKFLEERLDYLSESTTRLNKFDWSNLLISIITGIAINMAVDIETGRQLSGLINQAFANIKSLLLNQ
jgi:hypothetical protein